MAEQLARQLSCIILAGGKGTRMHGEDKGLVEFHGRPMIEHVLERIVPSVDDIVISANRNQKRYESYSSNVVADSDACFAGPLAGIASGLPHCRHAHVLVIACDMPQLPTGLAAELANAIGQHEIAIIASNSRLQLALLIQAQLLPSINQALSSGQHRLMDWVMQRDTVIVEHEHAADFANLNTPHDLDALS